MTWTCCWHGAMEQAVRRDPGAVHLGSHLRSCTWGTWRSWRRMAAVLLAELARQAPLLPGADTLAFVDIDSTQKRVYGLPQAGRSFGYTKIAGQGGDGPRAERAGRVVQYPAGGAGDPRHRLRGGNAARCAARPGWPPPRCAPPGPAGARGWSWCGWTRRITPLRCCTRSAGTAPGSRSPSRAIHRSAPRSPPSRKMPGHPSRYPRAIFDEQLGCWVSEAEVAEVPYTAFTGVPARGWQHEAARPIDGRLIIRRVQDQNTAGQDGLFPVWRHHAVFTDSPFATLQAEGQHRDHADHRAGLRRLLRRAAGAPAIGQVRRQRRLAHLRRHRAQPAARRRDPGQPRLRPSPRRPPSAATWSASPPAPPGTAAATSPSTSRQAGTARPNGSPCSPPPAAPRQQRPDPPRPGQHPPRPQRPPAPRPRTSNPDKPQEQSAAGNPRPGPAPHRAN